MKSIKYIDLSPKPGKRYWVNCHRYFAALFTYRAIKYKKENTRKLINT